MKEQDSHLDELPTDYSKEVVNPREAVLPSSWGWLDEYASETLTCVRLLRADGKVSVFKMFEISGDTIAYYVKGRSITNSKLLSYSSGTE